MISLEMTSLKDTKLVTLASPSFWESPYSWTPVTLLSFASDDLQINHKKTGFNEFHSFQCDLYAGHPLGFLLEKKKQASIITHSSLSLLLVKRGQGQKIYRILQITKHTRIFFQDQWLPPFSLLATTMLKRRFTFFYGEPHFDLPCKTIYPVKM